MGFFYKLGTVFRLFLTYVSVFISAITVEFCIGMLLMLLFKLNMFEGNILWIIFAITAGIFVIIFVLHSIAIILSGTFISANRSMDEYNEEERERQAKQNETMMNLALKDYHWKKGRWF